MGCIDCGGITLFKGDTGVGITSITWTSNSAGSPQFTQGTTDTYTITYTDGTTDTIGLYNGTNGAAGSNGNNGNFVQATVEAAGVNCTYGGVKIEVIQGVDGVTVLSTNYVCNINPTYNYGLFAQTAGVNLVNTVVATSMTGVGEGSLDIAANSLIVGDSFAFKATGLLKSNLAATLTLELKANGVVLSTVTTPILSIDPAEIWVYEAEFTTRTIGATGSIYTASELSINQTAPAGEHLIYPSLSSATVNTTILNTIDLVATYSLAGAGVTLSTEVLTLIKNY